MPLVTPFAQTPTAPEPIIAQVRRQPMDEAHEAMRIQADVLDRVADRAVRELWGSRVKSFVPVLALRTAREMLRDQDLLITAERPPLRLTAEATATRNYAGRTPRDLLPIRVDVLALDDRDAMSL
ncbi:MAG: hypothetical protein KY456_13330 [Chloroflexi bacterium]|nr:hypothetical protein [Chloroflexota bacterium]